MKESPKNPESRLVSEIKKFEALGAWCTPEFLMQSSQSAQSTHHLGERQSRASSTVAGQYLASRNPLAGLGQIDGVVGELRRLLESTCDEPDGTNRNDLLQVWMSVERCLTEDEHRQLCPAVLNRLFPDYKAPTALRRDGTAQVGGH
jgi:hypothetical protein